MANDEEQSKEDLRTKMALNKKYSTRITIARHGREAMAEKNYILASQKYFEYLKIHAEMNAVEDIFKIIPQMFDSQRDVTEMLLISHVYWDLAKINEMTPKLQSAFQLSLSQFVVFTINQPYQVLNAEMLRKYIRKQKGKSPQEEALNVAYQQIFVQSKKCFIATMCYQDNQIELHQLRQLKNHILKLPTGIEFVRFYYLHSSRLVKLLENFPRLQATVVFFIKPLLSFIAKMTAVKRR